MATDESNHKMIRYSNVLAATRSGNLSELRRLLDEGHPIDCKDNQNWIALHAACYEGYSNILLFLLNYARENELACDINYRSHEGFTPIFIAIREGFRECVEILLEYGADVRVGVDGLGDITVLFGENDDQRNNCFQCFLEWIEANENGEEILKILDGSNNSWMEVVVRAALRNNPTALDLVIRHCRSYLVFTTVVRVVLFSISHSGKDNMINMLRNYLGDEEYISIVTHLFREKPSAVVWNVEKEISLPLALCYIKADNPSKVPIFLGECCGAEYFWELMGSVERYEVALMSLPLVLDSYGQEIIDWFTKKFDKELGSIKIYGKRVVQYASIYVSRSKFLRAFSSVGIPATLSITSLCINCNNLDLLLKLGAPVNAPYSFHIPPIGLCLELQNFKGACTLLEAGAACYHSFVGQEMKGNHIMLQALYGGWKSTLLLQKLGVSLESLINFERSYAGYQFKLSTVFYYFNQYSQWRTLLNILLKWFKLPFEVEVAKKCYEYLTANSWNKSVWSQILREELSTFEKPLLMTLKHLSTLTLRKHLKFESFQNPKLLCEKLNIPEGIILYVYGIDIPMTGRDSIFRVDNYEISRSNYLKQLFIWLETVEED
ncbi:unnamed protein product [Dimorphilus gyrociliatus]|uniref:Uncharacterized protein n=1 Tax=Dimorphilus gyrociliatus TaxID=2664684 RepID=A0A7I8W2W3_9ANNE|nr:unnamed protein product [Dimorphilus gyrociliatus]